MASTDDHNHDVTKGSNDEVFCVSYNDMYFKLKALGAILL